MLLAIKAVLIIVGIFIVAGFVFVAKEIYHRATVAASADGPTAPAGAAAVGPIDLVLSASGTDAQIKQVTAIGNRLVVQVGNGTSADRLYIVDPVYGRITVRLSIGADAAAAAVPAGIP